MRVVLITQIPPAAHGLDQLLRVTGVRYGEDAATHVLGAPAGLDVLIPAGHERIAPLLRRLEPDVALCAGFPWKIPADALTAPRLRPRRSTGRCGRGGSAPPAAASTGR